MAHPFQKMFLKAITDSTATHNDVLATAESLLSKGYSRQEVCGVLEHLESSLLDDHERSLVEEARTELCSDDDL